MVPSTHFVTNIECTDTTGKGIAREILDQLKKRGIPPEKIMSLGSDGASAMTGKYNEFGTTSDHIANGLKRKVGSQKFISITYMMMDAMAPVTALSQFFQKENIDVALVKVKLDFCVKELLKVKSMETGHLKQLSEDLKNETFKDDHHILKTPGFNLQSLVDTFITALVDNILSRFPSDDLLTSFGILSMRPISFLNEQQLDDYGQNEIDKLCQHYGEDQTMTWKEDGKTLHKTTPPIINSEQTIKEWALLKKVVLAQHYPRDSSCELWQLIHTYHAQDFPNMIKLGQLALTLAVHTAGCERGFSVQNQTLTASRNRMTVQKQDSLMRVKLGPSRKAFKFEASLNKWKTEKERRLYELKQYK
ncbi:zinc finger protein 862-like [Haliotis asinina]|uniref:zinc finger protein 862-like n=1 Tax=Haliotis asinina TaxID=109174 RepID=UPI0035327269